MAVFDDALLAPAARAPFDDAALYQHMFSFEAALAEAQAAEGVIPVAAAKVIGHVCRAELYDLAALSAASARAGSVAIPVVQQLRQTVALYDAASAASVHVGSTSQDVLDSAMAMATQRSLALLDTVLCRLVDALLRLADAHAATPMLARTLLQPARVTSFGLKALGWAEPVLRARQRLADAAGRAIALQLGGAIGTFDADPALQGRGPAVAARMARRLGLALPTSAWHVQRDDWVRLGMEAAVLTGSLGKLAGDIAAMAQLEFGELAEPHAPGRGSSSAMPHKRNPVGAMTALAAAQRAPQRAATVLAAMGQQHERGLGNWQAELAEWPALFIGAHAAALALADVCDGLEVHPERMRTHVDALAHSLERAADGRAPTGSAASVDRDDRADRADTGEPEAKMRDAVAPSAALVRQRLPAVLAAQAALHTPFAGDSERHDLQRAPWTTTAPI